MDQPHVSSFRYEPLGDDKSRHEIRLLALRPRSASNTGGSTFVPEFECEMVHANIEDALEYKALSYTWGNATDGTHEIFINDCVVEIRLNLYHGLLQIQQFYNERTLIWVDALCIDQSNIDERNHQVTLMHMLYQHTEQVIVWLGLEADDSKKAIKFLKCLHTHIDEISSFWATLTHHYILENVVALSKLLSRPYWQRIWVVQELMAGKNVLVVCGEDYIEWSRLDQVQRAYFDTQIDVARYMTLVLGRESKNVFMLTPIYTGGPRLIYRSQNALKNDWTLFKTLQYFLRAKKATDPRDMIYALSSTVNSPGREEIIIDYHQSIATLYASFTRTEIWQTAKLDVWGALSERQSIIPGLPTWVVDWSIEVDGHCFLFDPFRIAPERYRQSYKAAGDSKATVTFEDLNLIKVRAVQLGRVDVLCRTMHHTMDSSESVFMPALKEWRTMLLLRSKDPEVQVLQLARTLAADALTVLVGKLDNRFYSGLLAKIILKAQDAANMSEFPSILSQCTETKLTGLTEQAEEQLNSFCSYAVRFIMSGRRLFFNKQFDTIGVCPDATKVGDLLCIPYGCPFVMVFRPRDDRTWAIIGPAYMDEFMYGSALTLVEKGELEVKEFVVQ